MTDTYAVDQVFGPRFLLERLLLTAVRAGDGAAVLVDEIDRADDEFEAFLLELLSDFQSAPTADLSGTSAERAAARRSAPIPRAIPDPSVPPRTVPANRRVRLVALIGEAGAM